VAAPDRLAVLAVRPAAASHRLPMFLHATIVLRIRAFRRHQGHTLCAESVHIMADNISMGTAKVATTVTVTPAQTGHFLLPEIVAQILQPQPR